MELIVVVRMLMFITWCCFLVLFASADEVLDISSLRESVIEIPHLLKAKRDPHNLTYHGVGALSGGGATTRLLIDYPEPQRSEILDILFKPHFAASLQILKVEIGGDSQSTDGTESSHMHSRDDLDCTRGYEWWLLKQAKKRNPAIITYGLPWAFPGWVNENNTDQNPFAKPELTTEYILQWLKCARDEHNINIDLIGLWNECGSPDMGENEYAKLLRKKLDEEGFSTKIVAKDNDRSVCDELADDQEYNDAVYAVGLHYPSDYPSGTYDKCHALNKPFWSSEESSSYADNNGAACWIRVITSHFVLSGMTSNIMWNLVAAYMHGTNWYNSALFRADQPWTGNYDRDDAAPVVWATAHITQFTEPGWTYLPVGSGSGELTTGGFFTSLISPDKQDFTFIAVKISRDHAECTRPRLPDFDVEPERIVIRLPDSVASKELHIWKSNFEEDKESYFNYLGTSDVSDDGSVYFVMGVGDVVTISTIDTARKGTFDTAVPESVPSFPLPYSDNFESYRVSGEAKYFSDQIGSWEVHPEQSAADDPASNMVMRQMVPSRPIAWGMDRTNELGPLTIIGQSELNDVNVKAKFRIPLLDSLPSSASACIGARLNMYFKGGVVLCVSSTGAWILSENGPFNGGDYDKQNIIASGSSSTPVKPGFWYTLHLVASGSMASGTLDQMSLFINVPIKNLISGFAAIGCSHWLPFEFDDIHIELAVNTAKATTPIGSSPPNLFYEGQLLSAAPCARNGLVDPKQSFLARFNWQLYHKASGLCAEAESMNEASSVRLARCRHGASEQQWRNRYTNIRNWPVELTLGAWKDLSNTLKLVGYKNGVVASTPGGQDEDWREWVLFPNTGQLRNTYGQNTALGYPKCLTVHVEEDHDAIIDIM